MRYRQLGKTGLDVSEIGFGAWGIGEGMWRGADDRESLRALHRAADLGVNFVDTAIVYGDGHSEQIIARLLRERPERIIVASKIPPKNQRWPARPGTPLNDAFPRDHIISSTERSLKNLAVDTIDIQQFHVWSDDWKDMTEWQDAIAYLKDSGKIRHFGVSVNDHQPESVLGIAAAGKVEVIQVIYNIFDQSPEEELFPLCEEKKIGVIARVPFDEGGLTGSVTASTLFPEKDWRNRYFRGDRKAQVEERVNRLSAVLGNEARSLPELALRFCLQAEAVSTVIPGMRTATHVASNCDVSDGRRLSDSLMTELRKHRWQRNFY